MMNSGKKSSADINNAHWSIEYDPRTWRDFEIIDRSIAARIKASVDDKLIRHPMYFGVALTGIFIGYYKFRVGNYRVIFRVEGNTLIIIVVISHRKDVYKKLQNRI